MNSKLTIKFREEVRNDAFYEALRNRVDQYLNSSNESHHFRFAVLKTIFYCTLFVSLYLALLFADLSFTSSLIVWSALGLAGILMGLNVAHDAAHNTLFRNELANKIIYFFTFSALGANAYLWQMRHIDSHHLFPNVDDCDADIDDNPVIRLSPYQPLRWYQRYQWLYAPVAYLFYSLLWVFYKDFIILNKKQLANLRDIKHPKFQVMLFYGTKTLYIFNMIGLPLLCTDLSLTQILAGFLLMHFVSSYAFIFGLIPSHFSDKVIFAKVDQQGFLEKSWAGHQVAASLDYHATQTWANFVFGGFNAHVAHHLFPTVNHLYYPNISKIIAKTAREFNIHYQNVTLFEAIRSHFSYLKKLSSP